MLQGDQLARRSEHQRLCDLILVASVIQCDHEFLELFYMALMASEVFMFRRNGAPPWLPDVWGNTMLLPLRNPGPSEPNRLQISNHPLGQNGPGF